eukprot:CAMPEP_0205808524 /NCGR_PEP_ID=MMETSP0205-20121125/12481_1 /ASSEMBLY_ACC=CAM_ASM_000278 /TAXON_ID=36767 /ORGANISM="Euplotes focardii, Strain TN1" /LENGTH=57 /DNA_ID=CAMNT_0053084295 /DNA_START=787 /DNA_END=960 /DNA_ORIENTATION=-
MTPAHPDKNPLHVSKFQPNFRDESDKVGLSNTAKMKNPILPRISNDNMLEYKEQKRL